MLLVATSASAQPPLTSNRPGIGDSEALVGRGVIQVEAGVQMQGAPPALESVWTQTWGQLTVRAGLVPRLEIFAGWDGLSLDRVRVNGVSHLVTGGNDLRLGFKVALLEEEHQGITVAVAPAWSFPVGAEAFSSSSNDGSLRLLWARSLPRNWSVSGNVVSSYTTDRSGRYLDNGVMTVLTRSLTPSVTAFGEVAGALLAGRPDAWTIDAGAAWVARPNLQWDVSAGHTFHDRGDDWFISAGVTLRRR